jgi:hypothetical protein
MDLNVPATMQETWLYPNRRAILFGCVPLAILAGLGAWLAWGLPALASGWRIAGWLLVAVGVLGIAMLLLQISRPRIAYRRGHVLFYLSKDNPIATPVEIVEAFFLGQGPAGLPGAAANEETVNLVARLSQRETDWAKREVKPALGAWCGGYVTIRGPWCEPLTNEVIRRLNKRLKEVQTECEQS